MGIEKYKLALPGGHRDVECSMESVVGGIVTTLYSEHWSYWGDHFVGYMGVWLLYCTPETNIK